MHSDLWGNALLNYHLGQRRDPLILHTSFGDPELVSLEIFFRDHSSFSDLELYACELCAGTVLDVGAGAGCHALALQQAGYSVTALEKSPGACKVMNMRGIREVAALDIDHFSGTDYGTALMMMNGLGLAGSLKNLPNLLYKVFSCLTPDGQIVADSSDIAYLYQGYQMPEAGYYGELEYCYEYQGKRGPTFPWLFVDFDRLKHTASTMGLTAQLVFEEEDQYLARITRS